jgi:hypothetical protein
VHSFWNGYLESVLLSRISACFIKLAVIYLKKHMVALFSYIFLFPGKEKFHIPFATDVPKIWYFYAIHYNILIFIG